MSEAWIFALKLIGIIVVSYFIGNVNFADILSKSRHVDIHAQGSGNPGTMNMLRTFGAKAAVTTLLLDVLKGLIPAIAGYYIIQLGPTFGTGVDSTAPAILGYWTAGEGKLGMIAAGLAAVLGHAFPVINKFRGGKGVATALGVFLAMNPLIAAGTFLLGLLYLVIHKYGCVSSFICILLSSAVEIALAAVFHDNLSVIIMVAALAVLIVSLHHPNIRSLIKGTERDSNLIRMLKAKKEKKAAQAEASAEDGATEESVAPTVTEEKKED